MKTLSNVTMLYRVNFSSSFVCDLKSCLVYYFDGSNVCRKTPASIWPNAHPFEERSMNNEKKGRKTDVEKPKGSEKRKPVCHPFLKHLYMDCQGMKSRLLQ